MVGNNENSFNIYYAKNIETGKYVSNITNPRHKYWDNSKSALNSVHKYMFKGSVLKDNRPPLGAVEIKCVEHGTVKDDHVK